MGQQTKDSNFCEYGLSNPERVLTNPDKPLLSQLPGKNIVLGDLQNVDTVTSQSERKSGNKSGSAGGSVEVSGAEISNDCPLNVSQSPVSKTSNAHLVYVRRKPEAVSAKSKISNNQCGGIDFPQSRNIIHQDGAASKKIHSDQPVICTVETQPISHASSVGFSSERISVSQCLETSNNILSPANLSYPQLSPVLCRNKLNQQWQERYIRLQNALRMLNQSDQHDYTEMLMTLSSVELSRIAVDLEKRSIQLSLEEEKEFDRVRILDVMGKFSKSTKVGVTQEPPLPQDKGHG